jgi:chromosome segregation ATPase
MAAAAASTSTSDFEEGISNPNGHEDEITGYTKKIEGYEKKIEGYEEDIGENKKKISIIETNLGGGGGGTSGDQEEIIRLRGENQTLQQAVTAETNNIVECRRSINLLREQQGRQGEKLLDVLHSNILPHCLGAF